MGHTRPPPPQSLNTQVSKTSRTAMISNVDEVIDACLNRMKDLAEGGNYTACASLASDLTMISYRFDYESGMLLSEVVGDAFGQVDHTLRMRVVDENYQNKVREELKLHLDGVLQSYKKDNKNDLFNALMKIRSTATRLYHYGFELPRSEEADALDGGDG